jgi:hypothetical protein
MGVAAASGAAARFRLGSYSDNAGFPGHVRFGLNRRPDGRIS